MLLLATLECLAKMVIKSNIVACFKVGIFAKIFRRTFRLKIASPLREHLHRFNALGKEL